MLLRSRWAAIGAAVAITLAGGGVSLVGAAVDSGDQPVTVLLDEPCRLRNTRPSVGIGGRTTPVGAGEEWTVQGTGSSGNCTIPADAVGLVMNITGVDASTNTNLRLYPAGGTVPTTSNLNPRGDGGPAVNSVTVGLSSAGEFTVRNAKGTVNVIIDITAYLADHDHDDRYYTEGEVDTLIANNPGPTGPQGPPGDTGDQGPTGEPGVDGAKGDIGDQGPTGDQGEPGVDGRSVLSGAGAPSDVTGVDGDFWIDTDADAIYGPKADGTWSETGPTSLIGPTGPQGDKGEPGTNAGSPARVIWVADDGTGDFTSLSAALGSITDASAGNPYLIRIAPGIYTETSPVTTVDHVDIEGSGQGNTTIRCTTGCSSSHGATSAVLAVSTDSEIRRLTIENQGGGTYAFAVYTSGSDAKSLLHITATATGATNSYGVYNSSSSPTMTNVTVTANGDTECHGVYNGVGSSPTMTGVTVTATAGTTSYGVRNEQSSSPTMIDVTVTTNGDIASFGVYNKLSSPTMTNVTVAANGDTENKGVYNISSTLTMTNVTATATDTAPGGTKSSYGVSNSSSSLTMTNVTATATDGAYNVGVGNSSSSPTMTNVTATATGGTTNYGVSNTASGSSPTIRGSHITGATHSIYNISGNTAFVADTMLDGSAGGSFTCVGAYDASFAELDTSCVPIP